MNIRKIRELGLIKVQVSQIRDLDALSELEDLNFLSELERKVRQACKKIPESVGESHDPTGSLDAGLKRLLDFTVSFESMVNAFEDGLEPKPDTNGCYSKVVLENHPQSLVPLWKKFEDSLKYVEAKFTDEDWVDDGSGGKTFCPLLASYDQLKNSDDCPLGLKLSDSLSGYLRDSLQFKQDCLRKAHQAKGYSEKLLERRSNALALIEEAKRQWEQGEIEEVGNLLAQLEKEPFSDIDPSELKQNFSKFTELKERIKKYDLKSTGSIIPSTRVGQSESAKWKKCLEYLDREKSKLSSLALPSPVKEKLDDLCVSTERTLLSELSMAEKAEKVMKAKNWLFLICVGGVVVLLILPFLFHLL